MGLWRRLADTDTHFTGVDVGKGTGHQSTDESTEFENGSEETFEDTIGVRFELVISASYRTGGRGAEAMTTKTYSRSVSVNKHLHDLDLTKDTLVVSIQDTTEGCKHGET